MRVHMKALERQAQERGLEQGLEQGLERGREEARESMTARLRELGVDEDILRRALNEA